MHISVNIFFTVRYFTAVQIPVVVPGRLLGRGLLRLLGRQRGAAEAGGGPGHRHPGQVS